MDPSSFDALARLLSQPGGRRRLLAGLVALLPAGGLAELLTESEAARRRHHGHLPGQAKRKRQRRRNRRKRNGSQPGADEPCGPATCSGCCDANSEPQCLPGNDDGWCGTGGQPCQACVFDGGCTNGQCLCTAANCPTGCCEFGPGQPGECFQDHPDLCGTGGVWCGFTNGTACRADDDCCSGTCFNAVCADLVTQCGATPGQPPARGCAEDTCCMINVLGEPTVFGCGTTCCDSGTIGCCGNFCMGPGDVCCGTKRCDGTSDVKKCCGDNCCPTEAKCCGNTCCAADAVCCDGGGCCPANNFCTSTGTCCEIGQTECIDIRPGLCCNAGEQCCDIGGGNVQCTVTC